MVLTYAYDSGYIDMPDVTCPEPLPPIARDPLKQYQAAQNPFSRSYSCKSTPSRSSKTSNPDSGIEVSRGSGSRKVSEVSNPDSGIDVGGRFETRKASEVSNPDSGIDVGSVLKKAAPPSLTVSADSTAQFSIEGSLNISDEEPESAFSVDVRAEIEPKIEPKKKSKPTLVERFMGFVKKFDECVDERLALRQQKKEAREMKVEKRRDSMARTKAIDSWHKKQIKVHLAKEKTRNKKAKKQMEEQKREVRQKKKKKSQALKGLKRGEKQEEKAERKKSGSPKRFFARKLWLYVRVRKKRTRKTARSVQQVVSDRERSLESEEESDPRPAVRRRFPRRPRTRAYTC